MPSTIFTPALDAFCQAYLVTNPRRVPDPEQLLPALKVEQENIFEQLLLFDRISFKVYGENVLVPVLINTFGLPAFTDLLEQRAIGFTLWTPMVGHFVDEIPGLVPLTAGNLSSPAHCDPEQSIELGFEWMDKPLPRKERRALTKKLLKAYEVPPETLSHDAVRLTLSAYKSGKLGRLGLPNEGTPLESLALAGKKVLSDHATRLVEYSYMVQGGMTSFAEPSYFNLLADTATKVQAASTKTQAFGVIAELEKFPDLRAIAAQIDEPYAKVAKLQSKHSAVKFRKWLDQMATDPGSFNAKAYIDAIEEAQGFFETKKGRVVKSVTVTTVGAALGGVVGGLAGAAVGSTLAKVAEPAMDHVFDLVDEFVISGLSKGWTPRMFLGDLRKLQKAAVPQ